MVPSFIDRTIYFYGGNYLVSEAVRRFCGDSLYALRRVKDAANVLGLREKNERLEN